eukprot:COSAG06_NODE_1441_length_9454_cov_2.073437_8_plen_171_part_00
MLHAQVGRKDLVQPTKKVPEPEPEPELEPEISEGISRAEMTRLTEASIVLLVEPTRVQDKPKLVLRGPSGQRQPVHNDLQLGRNVVGLTDPKLTRSHSQLHDLGADGWAISPLKKNVVLLRRGAAPVEVVKPLHLATIMAGDCLVLGKQSDLEQPNREQPNRELWVELQQ